MPVTDSKISVLMASPEVAPYAKTGGLGDVMGSLPHPLAEQGVGISIVMPAFRCILQGGYGFDTAGIELEVPISNRIEVGQVLKGKTIDNIPIYLIKADKYFDRDFLYGTPDGDYPDNAERFVFFSRAVLEVARSLRPDILHTNDWQSALAIAFLKTQPNRYPELAKTRTVMTIHNLGYQGRFWGVDWHLLNMDRRFYSPPYLEFHRDINFLKGGIVFADAITTVSPTYSLEIQTPELGFGLEGVFKERANSVHGILNGVDYRIWSPETDELIVRNYSHSSPGGKKACKADLQREFGLEVDGRAPLLGMVTRLSTQKGVDLVLEVLPGLLDKGCQFVLLGSGDREPQEAFQKIAASNTGRLGLKIGFSESLAHRIIAGADVLLMPSLYEPGGLTQLYALKYGTIPVVRATGGLKDTIVPFSRATGKGNGFVFEPYRPSELRSALDGCLEAYADQARWYQAMGNAMMGDYSWTKSAKGYLEVYKKLLSS